jgi:hypothetical protein
MGMIMVKNQMNKYSLSRAEICFLTFLTEKIKFAGKAAGFVLVPKGEKAECHPKHSAQ